MRSLERKVVAGLSILLIVAFSVILLFSVLAVKSLSESYVFTRLEHDAEALLAAVWKNPKGLTRIREGRITPIYQQPYSGHYFQLIFSDGFRLNSRSTWDYSFETHEVPVSKIETYSLTGPDEQMLLVRSAGYEKNDLKFTLSVAENIEPLESQIRFYQLISFVTLILAALIIILSQRYILRKGFRELDKVRDEIKQISSGELQQLSDIGPTEVQPVTIEINRLLKQLQKRLRRSRDALGNLAHALKSPISLMTYEIDHLSVTEPEKKNLSDNLSRIRNLIDRELKRARLASGDAGRYFNPSKDIPDLIQALLQIYHERQIDIQHNSLPDKNLPVDHEDMLELLGNLLDNACNWTYTAVYIDIKTEDKLFISISDNGPGATEEEIADMVKRGVRIDENKSGSGLGLSIVHDIVSDYSGTIEYAKSKEMGGLQVSVAIPLAQLH
ncbi:MAG: sensor histidine kinase [Gammaproteobacteria bacterium]|nr:sensor histidine kinase [Gammaproteobacteria bacterium]